MSPDIKVILAILVGLTASALARFSNGPSAADTYTGGFLYWLGYSGFDFGVIAAGIVGGLRIVPQSRPRAYYR